MTARGAPRSGRRAIFNDSHCFLAGTENGKNEPAPSLFVQSPSHFFK